MKFAGGAGILFMAALPPAAPSITSQVATCPTRLTSAKAAMIAALFDSADSIVTYRVDPNELLALGQPDTTRKVGWYRVVSGGRTASDSDRSAIRKAILEPDAYHRHTKQCLFSPGVGIEFVRPDTSGFMLICFSCTQFVVGEGPTRTIAFGDFDLARPRFVALVQRLLPDDAELKSLKTTTGRPPGH